MANENQKIYFPNQRPAEEVFLLLRKHWFVYVPVILIIGLMFLPLVAILIYLCYYSADITAEAVDMILIISSAYSLFILGLTLFVFVDYYLDVDIVTNQRIVDIAQNGFFQRKISESSLDQVEDVSAAVNGVFPTLFHYGDLHIQTAGTLPNFIFESIPHPYRISKIILDLHDAANAVSTVKRAAKLAEIRNSLGNLSSASIKTTAVLDNESSNILGSTLDLGKQNKILAGVEEDKQKLPASQ